jgi:uncharacterized alpha-E superfamily protein
MQRGGGSKDTWILASGPVDTFSLLTPADQPVELTRAANDLPSRVADNIFWLGRYAERAEDTARLLRSILTRLTGEERASGKSEISYLWQVFRCLRYATPQPPEPGNRDLAEELEQELLKMVFESDRQGSLRATLQRLSRISSIVRDRLSVDTVSILSQLHVRGRPSRHRSLGDVLLVLNRRITTLAAFRGIEMENITRGPGWRFLNIGRRLERVTHIIQLFRGLLVGYQPGGLLLLEMLLEVADSSMTYRSRYFTTLQPEPVLDLLMKDETNPRSLAFQLADLRGHLLYLPRLNSQGGLNQDQERIDELLASLRQADTRSLCVPDANHFRPQLAALLDRIAEAVPALSNAITHHYFSHAQTTRQLASLQPLKAS